VAAAGLSEVSDDYPTIARLNTKWRVIACADGIQWILQVRCGQQRGLPRWKNRYFCRTRIGLVHCACTYARDIDPEAMIALLRLPDRFDGGAP
jgi:hypothetical protein